MKKVLIWNADIPLKNAGGPGGYLYNIFEYLKIHPVDEISFLSELIQQPKYPLATTNQRRSLVGAICNRNKLLTFLLDIYHLRSWYKKKKINLKFDINRYDVIHFHNVFSIISYRDYLKDYQGKVLLTSHMPEPPISEISYSFKVIGPYLRKYQEFIIQKELGVIKKINPIWVFPAKDAMEPYINLSKVYKEYFHSIAANIRFIPTCTLDIDIIRNNNFFSKYNIPRDAFVISYIGRHSSIKGYDTLKLIGEKILLSYPNVYFVIAGKEEPLKGLDHNRWIELGWINNSSEIIANSDLFILPNDQTFFDLIFIEVLRAGTAILATNTGGNKYFAKEINKDKTKGIYFFERGDVLGAVNVIENLLQLDTSELGLQNRRLWENQFTLGNYINNYEDLLNNL